MRSLSALLQFLIGFFLGVFFLVGGTAALGFVFLSRMTASPPKPIFAEEKEQTLTEKPETTADVSESPDPEPETLAEASPEPVVEEKEKEELPAGAYKARVTWSDGLSLRSTPGYDAERIGGVGYNSELIILRTEGEWQRVRLPNSGQEGWVKAGNVARVD